MIDGPMRSRRRVIEEKLLERALNELEQAMTQDDLEGILDAAENVKNTARFPPDIPEKMPKLILHQRLESMNNLLDLRREHRALQRRVRSIPPASHR